MSRAGAPEALRRLSVVAGSAGVGTALAAGVGLLPLAEACLLGAVALGAAAGSLATASALPGLGVFGPTLVRAAHPGRLALTFDDGPLPDSTPRVMALLAEARVRATFFVLVDRAERHPDIVRALLDAGHEVQLHGARHDPWLTTRAPRRGADELRDAARRLTSLGAPTPRWLRPPFGAVSPRLYASAAGAGLGVAWCSVRTGDGGPASADRIRARCAAAVGTDIVLLHDNGRHTAALLPDVLLDWESRGITPAPLRDCLAPEAA